jgi:hypothetical protein
MCDPATFASVGVPKIAIQGSSASARSEHDVQALEQEEHYRLLAGRNVDVCGCRAGEAPEETCRLTTDAL